MQRRGFLGAMFAACAAPAIIKAGVLMPVRPLIAAPELFVVGDVTATSFSLTPGNQLLTISQITNEALRVLERHLNFESGISREWEAEAGGVIKVRRGLRLVT